MEDSPLQKLINAILLSAIKKGASAIRIVNNADPMRVYFDIGAESIEEMRPPGRLREPMMARLCAMSGADELTRGSFTLVLRNEEAHCFEVTLSPGKTLFLLVRTSEPAL